MLFAAYNVQHLNTHAAFTLCQKNDSDIAHLTSMHINRFH